MVIKRSTARVIRTPSAYSVLFESERPVSLKSNTSPLKRLTNTPINRTTIMTFNKARPNDYQTRTPIVVSLYHWFRRGFKPGVKMTVFFLVFLPLTLSLGFWQLRRAEQKLAMEQGYLAGLTALPKLPDAQVRPDDFDRLRLTGKLTDQVFWVDNQTRKGSVGYWAVQVLEQDDGLRWLVNRGFFAAAETNRQLPHVALGGERVQVVGVVWPHTGLLPLLRQDEWSEGWPKRIQRLDTKAMSALSGTVDAQVRLEESQWAPRPAPFNTAFGQDRHLGYVATWFGLAFALTCLYLFWGMDQASRNKQKNVQWSRKGK